MAYETFFLVIATLFSFFDLALLSFSKQRQKLRSYGFYAVILVFGLIALSYVFFFASVCW